MENLNWYDKQVHNLLDNPYVATLLLIYVVFIGIKPAEESRIVATRWFSIILVRFQEKKSNDKELIKKTRDLAKKIITLSSEKRKKEPKMDFNSFQESARLISTHTLDAMTDYAREYQPEVAYLRQEFIKRGLTDKELDIFYEHPTNYIGLGIIASKINELAAKLESKE